jgi:hypothetical protein
MEFLKKMLISAKKLQNIINEIVYMSPYMSKDFMPADVKSKKVTETSPKHIMALVLTHFKKTNDFFKNSQTYLKNNTAGFYWGMLNNFERGIAAIFDESFEDLVSYEDGDEKLEFKLNNLLKNKEKIQNLISLTSQTTAKELKLFLEQFEQILDANLTPEESKSKLNDLKKQIDPIKLDAIKFLVYDYFEGKGVARPKSLSQKDVEHRLTMAKQYEFLAKVEDLKYQRMLQRHQTQKDSLSKTVRDSSARTAKATVPNIKK